MIATGVVFTFAREWPRLWTQVEAEDGRWLEEARNG